MGVLVVQLELRLAIQSALVSRVQFLVQVEHRVAGDESAGGERAPDDVDASADPAHSQPAAGRRRRRVAAHLIPPPTRRVRAPNQNYHR